MKSPITKLTATTLIIITVVTVVFLITFLDKSATPVYALEQTVEANHTIKTIHLRMFEDAESIENNEFLDYWIKYDNAGKLSNLRCNEHDDHGVRFTVWNDGVSLIPNLAYSGYMICQRKKKKLSLILMNLLKIVTLSMSKPPTPAVKNEWTWLLIVRQSL
jgi:hypothetical protein